jgi:hypothetical protein
MIDEIRADRRGSRDPRPGFLAARAQPVLHTLAGGKQVILVGQKSSQVYALDPDAMGKVIWEYRLSVGGPLGGVEFGPAADKEQLLRGDLGHLRPEAHAGPLRLPHRRWCAPLVATGP